MCKTNREQQAVTKTNTEAHTQTNTVRLPGKKICKNKLATSRDKLQQNKKKL